MSFESWLQRVDSRFWVPATTSVAGNVTMLIAALWWGTNVHAIVVIYWLETAVVGVATVAKIRRAEGEDDPDHLPNWEYVSFGHNKEKTIHSLVGKPKRIVLWDFIEMYLVMWVIYGIFIVFILPAEYSLTVAPPVVIAVGTLGLTAYHAVSYRRDFINNQEYTQKGPVTVLVDPLQRVFVLVTIGYLSGVAIAILASPVGVVVVLVTAKTVFDIYSHRREHLLSSVETETTVQ